LASLRTQIHFGCDDRDDAGRTNPRRENRTYRRRGRSATLTPWPVLRHVVNHTTYHRGQVASKLNRFGVQQPETDLIIWAFEQIPQH
jgi:uncharacterized damage-inducible protein DinB